MKLLFALPLALSLSFAAACGGDTRSDTGSSDAADVKAGPLDLPKLGLKGEAPAGSAVGDAMIGEGHMIQGPNLIVTVETASDSRPKTGEDAQKEADMYTPKNPRIEQLADGWAFTFDNEGSLGKNFFVNVRREIDGKAIWCETTASTPEQQSHALAFCKSLRK